MLAESGIVIVGNPISMATGMAGRSLRTMGALYDLMRKIKERIGAVMVVMDGR